MNKYKPYIFFRKKSIQHIILCCVLSMFVSGNVFASPDSVTLSTNKDDASLSVAGMLSSPSGVSLLRNVPDVIISAGESIAFPILKRSYNVKDLFLDAKNLPKGAQIVNGLFIWTPSPEQSGSYEIEFIASDMKSGISDKHRVSMDILAPLVKEEDTLPLDGAAEEKQSAGEEPVEPLESSVPEMPANEIPANLEVNKSEEGQLPQIPVLNSREKEPEKDDSKQEDEKDPESDDESLFDDDSSLFSADSEVGSSTNRLKQGSNVIYAKQAASSNGDSGTDKKLDDEKKEQSDKDSDNKDAEKEEPQQQVPEVITYDVPELFNPGISSFTGNIKLEWSDVDAPLYEVREYAYINYRTFEKTYFVNDPYKVLRESDHPWTGYYYYEVRAWSAHPDDGGEETDFSKPQMIGIFYEKDIDVNVFETVELFHQVPGVSGCDTSIVADSDANGGMAREFEYRLGVQDYAGITYKADEPVSIKYMNALHFRFRGDSEKGMPRRMIVELKKGDDLAGVIFIRDMKEKYEERTVSFYSEIDEIDSVVFMVDDSTSPDMRGRIYIDECFFTEAAFQPELTPDVLSNSGPGIADKQLLDKVQADTSLFFYDEVIGAGHVKDASNSEFSSIAATGFGLATMAVLAERYGESEYWQTVTPQMAEQRVKDVLDDFLAIQASQLLDARKKGIAGAFYHFIDEEGNRFGNSEVSVVDTALLIAGAIVAGEYFGGEVKEKADQLYANVDWEFFIDSDDALFYMGWKHAAERGFLIPKGGGYLSTAKFDRPTDEILIVNMLALASNVDNELYQKSYFAYPREKRSYIGRSGEGKGEQYDVVNSYFGSLFTYLYAHCFFDFQAYGPDRVYFAEDAKYPQSVNWWENSVQAFKANRQFCIDERDNYPFSYHRNSWGISAVQRPDGAYEGRYGAVPFSNGPGNDGVVAFYGPLSSLPFMRTSPYEQLSENEGFQVIRHYYNNFYEQAYGEYGFYDSCDNEGNFSSNYLGLDQGPIVMMIENYRSDLIWDLFHSNEKIKLMTDFVFPNGFDWIDLELVNIEDNEVAEQMSFGYNSVGAKVAPADQYVKIDYNCYSPSTRIVIYTDNANNPILYTGEGDNAGLIGIEDPSMAAPLYWSVFDEEVQGGYEFSEDGSLEGRVQDMSEADFAFRDMVEKRTLVNGKAELGMYPEEQRDTDATALYLYVACDYTGLEAQSYGTERLMIEIYHE